MEENEQGLTKEEKFMFSILGIVLSIAIGVLIINSFSEKERTLQEETPIAEEKETKEEVQPNNNNHEVLIEDEEDETPIVSDIIISKPSKKPEQVIAKPSKPIKPSKPEIEEKPIPDENEGEGETIPENVLNWSIKENIVTEIYENEKLVLDNTIYLEDKTIEEAELKLIYLNNGTEEEILFEQNEIILKAGNYKYLYTFAGTTKELNLLVKKAFDLTNTTILNINKDTTNITDIETYNKINSLIQSTTININNGLRIDVKKDENNYNKLPVVIKIPGLTELTKLEINNPYITISRENNQFHKPLELDEVIMWIDIENFKNSFIKINIDDVIYEFKLTLVNYIEVEFTPDLEEKEENENLEETDKDNNKEDEELENIPDKEENKEENSLKPNLEIEEETSTENNNSLDENNSLNDNNNLKPGKLALLSQ